MTLPSSTSTLCDSGSLVLRFVAFPTVSRISGDDIEEQDEKEKVAEEVPVKHQLEKEQQEEELRILVNSAKFAAIDSPSGMSFTQAGAGFVVIAGVLYSAMRYYNRDNKVLHTPKKQG